ncbi:MFS transporter [Magnetospirillum molischianum]|uniref:Permease of the major facilitator superfamily n=1 Tax=Magnetospirillum molischianum DSM 120 TaxID=1150626 RepID=H8FV25_MAGML|nr:MFS transporter [Magnetospirillum molischianum]CCG42213.1 Permease of the major facilitator superfamily [Magnetospirillum molischianum DSM 120]
MTIPRPKLANLARALHHRNYRLFFAGQLISLIGTWMQTVAQSWLVYRLTGSAELLGLMGFAAQGPVFLLTTLGGVVADRFDRHRIMLITQTCAMVLAAILATLTLTERVQVWELFALATLLGISNAFDIPARQAFVVEMVGRDDLPNAIALNSSLFNGARLFGPAIAGLLVAAGGEGWCFAVNAVSYLAVISGLLAMRRHPEPILPSQASVLAHVREGFAFVASHIPIRALMLLLGISSLMGISYTVLMPIFADRILGGGPAGLGILMSASGLGALSAAIILAARGKLQGLETWVAHGSIAFGLALVLFSLSPWFWLSAAILVGAGFSFMVQMAASNTLIQMMVPDRYRGRTMALYSMMFIGMAPFGALLAGLLAGRIGAPPTVALGGLICAAAGIVFHRHLPGLRAERQRRSNDPL